MKRPTSVALATLIGIGHIALALALTFTLIAAGITCLGSLLYFAATLLGAAPVGIGAWYQPLLVAGGAFLAGVAAATALAFQIITGS